MESLVTDKSNYSGYSGGRGFHSVRKNGRRGYDTGNRNCKALVLFVRSHSRFIAGRRVLPCSSQRAQAVAMRGTVGGLPGLKGVLRSGPGLQGPLSLLTSLEHGTGKRGAFRSNALNRDTVHR